MFKSLKQTDFTKSVVALIGKIPAGKVASYGQIAELAGKPGSARAVGWILHSCTKSHQLPWQRVLNSQGKISFKKNSADFRKQKNLLQKEGIEVSASGQLNMKLYRWKKKTKNAADKKSPKMFQAQKMRD